MDVYKYLYGKLSYITFENIYLRLTANFTVEIIDVVLCRLLKVYKFYTFYIFFLLHIYCVKINLRKSFLISPCS